MVEEIEKNGIYTIAVTNSPSVFFYTKKISKNTKYLRPSLGFHPELVAQRYMELDKFLTLLPQVKYIGEIGLDNSQKLKEDFSKQLVVFKKIIQACRLSGNKILTVHSRNAASEVIEIIGPKFPGKVILHWYSGSLMKIPLALSYGFYFSINPKMLTSKHGRIIIKEIPLERILLESDAPFTIKENQVYSKKFLENMIPEIASIKMTTIENISYNLKKNFKELLQPNL